MEHERLTNMIRAKLGDAVRSMEQMKNDDLMIVLDAERFVESVGTLKNDPALGFTTLMNHLGVDYGDRFAAVYNLYSAALRAKITIKTYLDREEPELASLERAFPGISWFERETYDMFGIRFSGHSNLKRLLLPEDWEGYPLRKDYVYPASYHGIDTGREDLFDFGLRNADRGMKGIADSALPLDTK